MVIDYFTKFRDETRHRLIIHYYCIDIVLYIGTYYNFFINNFEFVSALLRRFIQPDGLFQSSENI